jgi:hypothetical protein
MDIELLLCSANEGQTHHGIAEMMEFDNKQARLHRANQSLLSL